MAEQRPICRAYDVDGQPVVARSTRPLTEKDLAALAEFQELLRTQANLRAAVERKEATEPDASITDQ